MDTTLAKHSKELFAWLVRVFLTSLVILSFINPAVSRRVLKRVRASTAPQPAFEVSLSIDRDTTSPSISSTTEEVDPPFSIKDLTRPDVLGVILALISLVGGLAAWLMRRRRRARVRTLLNEIDEVHSRFKTKTRRCEAELYRLKDVALEKLKTGKIDEPSYDVIKKTIDDYLHEIRERMVDERTGSFPSRLRDALHDMIKKGEISEKEYETLGRLIERTTELKEGDKAQLRELLEEWKKDYLKKEPPERPIERKAEPEERDRAQLRRTKLKEALGTGDVDRVKALLIEDPQLVNARTPTGYTPLHRVAGQGHAELASLLLAHGANVNARTDYGGTPLYVAAMTGHAEVARVFLARGAAVDAPDPFGLTPLCQAAFNGHAEVVRVLLAHGANVNAQSQEGYRASQLAAQKGHAEVAELLRKHENRSRA